MGCRFRVKVDGVELQGVLLEDAAPRWTALLKSGLPLERELLNFRWGGQAAYFLEPALAEAGTEVENPVTFYPRMSICIRPPREVVLAYGQAQARSLTIPAAYACHVADLDGDLDKWVNVLSTLPRAGGRTVQIALE